MKNKNTLNSVNLEKISTTTKQKISVKTKILLTVLIVLSIFVISFSFAIITVDISKILNNDDKDAQQVKLTNDYLNQEESLFFEIQNIIQREGLSWVAGNNMFSKYSSEERSKLLGLKLSEKEIEKITNVSKNLRYINATRDNIVVPDFFDFRNMNGGINYITSVKDQGGCGSCWAFAELALLESKINLFYNNPALDKDLSEQDLLSCYFPWGCSGGNSAAFSTLTGPGVCIESCFPYQAQDASQGISCSNKCNDWQNNTWKIDNYQQLPYGDINTIKQFIINNGPVYAEMAVYDDFFSYRSGVYQHVLGNLYGSHAVLIVGFGRSQDEIDYWIAKNSWGNSWGENINGESPQNCTNCGYFRIAMNSDILPLYGFGNPVSQENISTLCTDTDNDGYCYWGIGEKPANCPVCDDLLRDCDDSNMSIFENCGQGVPTGILSINSSQEHLRVYVRDPVSNNWIYRGTAPLQIRLNVGERDVKISKIGYLDFETTVNVLEDDIQNISVVLQQDPQFMAGWPIEMSSPITTIKNITVSDIDNDGFKEIIVIADNERPANNQNVPCSLYVFRSDGQIMNGWPQMLPSNGNIIPDFMSGPITVDLDGDGDKEIILATRGMPSPIHAYHHNGFVVDGFPVISLGNRDIENIVVVDINHDGDPEIISNLVGQSEYIAGRMYVLNSNGTILNPWPVQFQIGYSTRGVTLSDLNGDQNFEIISILSGVSMYNPYYISAYNYNREIVGGFPYLVNPAVYYNAHNNIALVSGDINNNGMDEIITPIGPISNNGEAMNWLNHSNRNLWSIALANVNENPNLEIVYGNLNFAYLTDYLGTPLNGWPKNQLFSFNNSQYPLIYSRNTSPVVADLFGDDKKEIVIPWTTNIVGAEPGLYIYNLDGTLVDDFPKFQNQFTPHSVIIDDIDNDNHLEIIFFSSNVYQPEIFVIKSPKIYTSFSSSVEWSRYQHDEQKTGNYGFGKTCIDGTEYNECSEELPKFCYNGQLHDNCVKCGCADGFCLKNKSCSKPCFDSDAVSSNSVDAVNGSTGNIYIPGYATGLNDDYSEVVTKHDECTDRSSLIEFGCGSNNIVVPHNINCLNGCLDGACLNQASQNSSSSFEPKPLNDYDNISLENKDEKNESSGIFEQIKDFFR